MSGHSFRFVHAASFHLQNPLRGMTDSSEVLLELFADAPLTSAVQVLEAAVREEVDFVLLSGDILDPTTAGPRAVTVLQEQFRTLKEHGIRVYWAASRLDLNGGWLRVLEWPENVCIFASDQLQRVMHCRGDVPVVEITGRSWHAQQPLRAAEFVSEPARVERVAVAAEQLELEGHASAARYWALGGSCTASTPLRGRHTAHCPGSPQGFSAQAGGPHGCTLVHVDAEGEVRTRMIASDSVRWYAERIPVGPGMTRPDLRHLIKKRVEHLLSDAARPLLVAWTLVGDSRFDSIFVEQREQEETLRWLRAEFGGGEPPLWSTVVAMEPPEALPPEWCEEDSILGDYLRVVQRYEADESAELDLACYLAGQPPRELADVLVLEPTSVRQQMLREAAILGADLLRGDEAPAD